jgi:hypothetical protein
MTLKERLKKQLDTATPTLNRPHYQAGKLEKIADEFAIGFAEWCDDNYFRMGNTSFWAESMDWDNDNKFTTKELLEIYKKEKGL